MSRPVPVHTCDALRRHVEAFSKYMSELDPSAADDCFITAKGNGIAWRVGPFFASRVMLSDPTKNCCGKGRKTSTGSRGSAELVELNVRTLLN